MYDRVDMTFQRTLRPAPCASTLGAWKEFINDQLYACSLMMEGGHRSSHTVYATRKP